MIIPALQDCAVTKQVKNVKIYMYKKYTCIEKLKFVEIGFTLESLLMNYFK